MSAPKPGTKRCVSNLQGGWVDRWFCQWMGLLGRSCTVGRTRTSVQNGRWNVRDDSDPGGFPCLTTTLGITSQHMGRILDAPPIPLLFLGLNDALVYLPRCLEYNNIPFHPLSPNRIKVPIPSCHVLFVRYRKLKPPSNHAHRTHLISHVVSVSSWYHRYVRGRRETGRKRR